MEVAFVSAAIGAGATMVLGGFIGIAVVGIIWVAIPGIRRYEYVEISPNEVVADKS